MEVVYEFGVPDPITDLGGIIDLHIRRRDRPGGVFHEYLHGESSQRLGRHRWVVEQTFLLADRHPPITPPLRTPGRSPRFLHRFSQRLSSATADSPNESRSKAPTWIHILTWAFSFGAGDGNRTRAVSLGS
jgi:hypothetical protein